MTIKTPKDIRDFWFSAEMERSWFKKSDDIDNRIIKQFSSTYEAAHRGQLDRWSEGAQDALALIITLDQFPRNMFRGNPRSFESNEKALGHARDAVAGGFDQECDAAARQFFYLPFMHSENLADQERSVELYEKLGNANSLRSAHEHRDIVKRFGRFPHRNAVLGRENTVEETEFLKTHSGF